MGTVLVISEASYLDSGVMDKPVEKRQTRTTVIYSSVIEYIVSFVQMPSLFPLGLDI